MDRTKEKIIQRLREEKDEYNKRYKELNERYRRLEVIFPKEGFRIFTI